MCCATSMPTVGAYCGSRSSRSWYRNSWSTPAISATRFTSTTTARPSPSRHSRSIGPMSVGNSRRTSTKSSRNAATRAAISCWSSASTPSFSRPGSFADLVIGVVQRFVDLDPEHLALGVGGDDGVVTLDDRARRVHPVERLVRLRVGVHRDRAVGLPEHETHSGRERRAEPAFVADRTSRDEQSHRRSLAPAVR